MIPLVTPFLLVGGLLAGLLFNLLVPVFLIAVLVWLAMGATRVPIGAKGLVIWMGRRSGDVRTEGMTWLPPLVSRLEIVYVRERQVEVPQARYHTADRGRLAFTTVLRVAVADPEALFEQGPGTYAPFTRDSKSNWHEGDEERNVALRRLMENSIREAVRSLTVNQILFGEVSADVLKERVREHLSRTVRRWGLQINDIWLTEIEAQDEDLEKAFASELEESMRGRGALAAQEAEVSKGLAYVKAARQFVAQLEQLGKEISLDEAVRFLRASYQSERELEIALAQAQNRMQLAHEWILHQGAHAGLHGGGVAPVGLPDGRGSTEAWVIGRDGEIVLDGDGVSRRHAQLEIDGTTILLTDLGSTNGTWVGRQRLAANQPTPITTESRVRFGRHLSVTGRELLEAARSGQ